jgi:hypothetical protein
MRVLSSAALEVSRNAQRCARFMPWGAVSLLGSQGSADALTTAREMTIATAICIAVRRGAMPSTSTVSRQSRKWRFGNGPERQ